MEDTSGAVLKAPFGKLISDWLDEGDRLSASAAAAPAPASATESRLRHVIRRLSPVIERHRLSVLVGMGLLPLALVLCLHRAAPASIALSSAAALPDPAGDPVANPAVDPIVPVGSHGEGLMSRGAELTLMSSAGTHAAPAMTAPTLAPTPPRAALASARSAAPHRHHHHHHTHPHAATATAKTVASSGRAARR